MYKSNSSALLFCFQPFSHCAISISTIFSIIKSNYHCHECHVIYCYLFKKLIEYRQLYLQVHIERPYRIYPARPLDSRRYFTISNLLTFTDIFIVFRSWEFKQNYEQSDKGAFIITNVRRRLFPRKSSRLSVLLPLMIACECN